MFHHFEEAEVIIAVGIALASAIFCGAACWAACKMIQCLQWNGWESPTFTLRFTGPFTPSPQGSPKPTFNSSPDDLQRTPVIDRHDIYSF